MVSLRNVARVCKSLGFRRGPMPRRSNRMAGDPAVIRHNGSARSVGFCDQHGLPGDHGRTSCQARATRRYAANDGAWNAFLVRAAPSRFIGCRCSAIQNNAQTNTCDPRRPGATSSLLSCRQSWTFGRRSSFRRSWAKTRLSNNEPTKKAISKSVSGGRNRYVRYCGYRTRERTWPYRRE